MIKMFSSDELYSRAEAYWAGISSNVNGMLGGFPQLHDPDIRQSRKFLKKLFEKHSVGTNRALDCGCGIGRVSKHLLLPLFDYVDLVDVNPLFIQAADESYFHHFDVKIGRRFVSGLQNFHPQVTHYDVIWIQWVSGHLTDEHFVDFFRRCKEGLSVRGCIILKENISSSSEKDLDSDDHSYTRPRNLLLDLFEKAQLTVIAEKVQTKMPKGMYLVRMFALK